MENELPYDPNDKNSIIEYAKKLVGQTLRETCDVVKIDENRSNKGQFGLILEEYYFRYPPNSASEPDFPIAKLELKSAPLKKTQKEAYRAKERLVLNMINYLEVPAQEFESSSFWKKNTNPYYWTFLKIA
jgi:DNA mismatch repair protein MutH